MTTLTQRYIHISEQLHIQQKRLSDLKYEMAKVEKQVAFLTEWQSEAKAGICSYCAGHGKYWHHYDQSDCKEEVCPKCNGTGALEASNAKV